MKHPALSIARTTALVASVSFVFGVHLRRSGVLPCILSSTGVGAQTNIVGSGLTSSLTSLLRVTCHEHHGSGERLRPCHHQLHGAIPDPELDIAASTTSASASAPPLRPNPAQPQQPAHGRSKAKAKGRPKSSTAPASSRQSPAAKATAAPVQESATPAAPAHEPASSSLQLHLQQRLLWLVILQRLRGHSMSAH